MTLVFPNRFVWLMLGLIIFLLLQSGCQPIQPPAATPTATAETDADAEKPAMGTGTTSESVSPDGTWTAATTFQHPRGSNEYYQSLVVTHASGAPVYTLVESTSPFGLGYTLPMPIAWSADGTRLYFSNVPHPDGCALFFNSSDLQQVDLATGEVKEILPPNSTYTLGLSPDETKLAYLVPGEPTMIIQELTSGQSTSFDMTSILSDDQAGAIIWSPTSDTVAFAIAQDPCAGAWAVSTSIYLLDVATLTLTPVRGHGQFRPRSICLTWRH